MLRSHATSAAFALIRFNSVSTGCTRRACGSLVPRISRAAASLLRSFAAALERGEPPPCRWQRVCPFLGLAPHGLPSFFFAPQIGRPFSAVCPVRNLSFLVIV